MASNKKDFFKYFWKREWFSLALVSLILFSSYAFYLSFPEIISFPAFNLQVPAYLIAFILPFILLLVYLYFIFFFKSQFSLKDEYALRDLSLGFLALIYFSLSLYAISFPINLSLWVFLFIAFYLIFLGGLFLKYEIFNYFIAKSFIASGFLLAGLSFFNINYKLIGGAVILVFLLSISLFNHFLKKKKN